MALLGDTVVPRVHDVEGGHTVELSSPTGDDYAVVQLLSR